MNTFLFRTIVVLISLLCSVEALCDPPTGVFGFKNAADQDAFVRGAAIYGRYDACSEISGRRSTCIITNAQARLANRYAALESDLSTANGLLRDEQYYQNQLKFYQDQLANAKTKLQRDKLVVKNHPIALGGYNILARMNGSLTSSKAIQNEQDVVNSDQYNVDGTAGEIKDEQQQIEALMTKDHLYLKNANTAN